MLMQKRVCARVRVCKRGQTEGAAVQGGEDAPGKGWLVTQLGRNLGRMVTSPPERVWDGGGRGFQAAAVTSLEGHAIARV